MSPACFTVRPCCLRWCSTALHLGASEGKLEIVAYLLDEGGVDPNCADRWSGTPLDDAHRHGHDAVVALLKARGAKVGVAKAAKDAVADLCDAAARGDLHRLRDLHASGIDPNLGDYDRRTAMHLGASEGELGVVEFLVREARCDPSPLDRWCNTPLDDALREDRRDVSAFLEANGGVRGAERHAALDQKQARMFDAKYADTHGMRSSLRKKNPRGRTKSWEMSGGGWMKSGEMSPGSSRVRFDS